VLLRVGIALKGMVKAGAMEIVCGLVAIASYRVTKWTAEAILLLRVPFVLRPCRGLVLIFAMGSVCG